MNRLDALAKDLAEEDAEKMSEEIIKGLCKCEKFVKYIQRKYTISIFNPLDRAVKVYKLIRKKDGIVLNTWEITDFSQRSIEEELERIGNNFVGLVWDTEKWKRMSKKEMDEYVKQTKEE
jgi:hypothetical protein